MKTPPKSIDEMQEELDRRYRIDVAVNLIFFTVIMALLAAMMVLTP
ncbi:hypothetical protein [Polaromonas sp.]